MCVCVCVYVCVCVCVCVIGLTTDRKREDGAVMQQGKRGACVFLCCVSTTATPRLALDKELYGEGGTQGPQRKGVELTVVAQHTHTRRS